MTAVPSPQYAPGTPAAGGRSEERGWLIRKVGVGGASLFSDVSQECLAVGRLRLRRRLHGGVHAHWHLPSTGRQTSGQASPDDDGRKET
jgi:hypothetical protein